LAVEAWLRPGMALALDMDGVVVDSNPLHSEAWRRYHRRFGIEPGDAFDERMYGKRNDEIVRDIFGPAMSDAEVAEHGAAKERLYREILGTMVNESLVPGVRDFLARHAGAPVGLATNAEPANVDFVLDGTGLRGYFRTIIDGHQVKHAKPHPEIYLRTAELLGVAPRNCIVFEDSLSGITAARAAGTRIVGVRTTHEDLPGVDLAIDDFSAAGLEAWVRAQLPDAA